MGNYNYDPRTGQYYPDNNGDKVFRRAAQGALLGVGLSALTGNNIGRGAAAGAGIGAASGLLGFGGGKLGGGKSRRYSRSRKSRRRLGRRGKKSRY